MNTNLPDFYFYMEYLIKYSLGIYKTIIKTKQYFEYISHLKTNNLMSTFWTNTKMDKSGSNHSRVKCTTAWWFLFSG